MRTETNQPTCSVRYKRKTNWISNWYNWCLLLMRWTLH